MDIVWLVLLHFVAWYLIGGIVTTILLVVDNSLNLGMRYVWDRRWVYAWHIFVWVVPAIRSLRPRNKRN